MTPEEHARQEIDRQLGQCGWAVQDRHAMNISAGRGVAVREFPLVSGFADYLLYANGKAIGVIEAKPEGHTLTGVETQSARYTTGFPAQFPRWAMPLPFAYESTGAVTQFTSRLDPIPRSRELFTFHRPEELLRLVALDAADQLRARLRVMPALEASRLWAKQITAVTNLEASLADNRPRSLIQMATGSGKTFTAANIAYRLIRFAGAKRILFLVDRNNLGRQTLNEFTQFASPYTSYKFTEEFNVQHLRRNTIDPSAKVVITTIQRLYSILKGEEQLDESAEETSLFESASALLKEPLPVVYNAKIPPETFDFIIVDECHRSIYNVWRQVLEYFDAFLVGLTATPSAQTLGFFAQNLVMDYSHEQAVLDGVNVGYDIYRIETQVTRDGAKLAKTPGFFVPRRSRSTRQKRFAELNDDLIYTGSQLDRDVVNESQLRLVLSTFRDRLFTEIFPGRSEVPKTLIFAKNDLHADDIVKLAREVFGKGNDFCVKITSKTTGRKPEDLLNEFRNSYHPRIAVTVDMIATGTDVKCLECVLFMRNINSAAYFEQMKGRGCRVIKGDDLQSVTPDARAKTHFMVVDAVGVTETDKTLSKPLDRKPTVPLEKILATIAAGAVSDELVSTLAARLARLDRELDDDQRQQIAQESAGQSPAELATALLASIDPDTTAGRAAAEYHLNPGQEPTDEQITAVEQQAMAEALKPFHNPKLRDAILRVRAAAEQVIDEQTQDKLIRVGFDAASKDKAAALVRDFRQFIEDNKEQIEAIQVLYSRPYRLGLRYRQVKDLAQKLAVPPFHIDAKRPETVSRLWHAFEAVEPQQVKGVGRQLVDLIALVRHALDPSILLMPVDTVINERYAKWLADKQAAGVRFSDAQRRWLDAIRDHIARSLAIEQEDLEEVPFKQMGGLGAAFDVFGDTLPGLLGELNERLTA